MIVTAPAQQVTSERLNRAEKEPHNWPTYGGTYRAWRSSALDQINTSNVHRLAPAWTWSFATGSGHRGSPISYSVNGRQYIATPSAWGSLAAGALPQFWVEVREFTAGATLFVFSLPDGRE